jgi:hypothetical protein
MMGMLKIWKPRVGGEPLDRVRVAIDSGREQFDRDAALQLGVARAIDLAHTACTKGRLDNV